MQTLAAISVNTSASSKDEQIGIIDEHLDNLAALAEGYHFRTLHERTATEEQHSVLMTIRELRAKLNEEKRQIYLS
jgi:hypothetical protein